MATGGVTVLIQFDSERFARKMRRATESVSDLGRALKRFEDDRRCPPSRELRELRQIADMNRLKARLWWERFKADGCRP